VVPTAAFSVSANRVWLRWKGASGVQPEGFRAAYFLRRLSIARAAKPISMPARIDSNGNPGIGGNAIGVETAIELEVEVVRGVVVGVLTTVVVTTEVLGWVVADVLADVTGVDDVELTKLVALDVALLVALLVVALLVEEIVLAVVTAVVAPPPYRPGGSRWKTKAKVPVPASSPTANPLVLDVRKMLSMAGEPVLGTGTVKGIWVHPVPS